MSLWMLFLVSCSITSFGQSEVPGDDFSLEGALELFKKSSSPEEFERLLNSADARVNNLDLNGDGDIDYIRVIDRNEGNVHAFILQAIVSERESQDVAVIELEKLTNGKAVLQIVGDADIYGMETIIEPTTEVRVNAGTSTARTVVNVWAWPSVQYVYSPYYSVWVSPWRWSMRPVWWHTWRPVAYYTYDPWWQPYRPYYSVCYTHRVVYAHQIYRPVRTTSVVVYNRHHDRISHYRSRQDSYYGQRNDVNRGRDSRNSNSYDQRGGTNRYSSAPDGNSNRINETRNQDWRNRESTQTRDIQNRMNNETNRESFSNQSRQMNDRSSFNGLNSTDQRIERRSVPTQNQDLSSRRMSSDFQRAPERTNRTSGFPSMREPNIQRQMSTPSRDMGSRQNSGFSQPSQMRNQQPSRVQGAARRGR